MNRTCIGENYVFCMEAIDSIDALGGALQTIPAIGIIQRGSAGGLKADVRNGGETPRVLCFLELVTAREERAAAFLPRRLRAAE
jgi:hypothetical protein